MNTTRTTVRVPTVREAIVLLREAGFEHVRTKGSHAVYRRASDQASVGLTINHRGADVDTRAMRELRKAGVL